MFLNKYIKDDGTNFILMAPYLEIYIPIDFFDKGISRSKGSNIQTFGLLYGRCFNESNKPLHKFELINLPTQIILYPTEMEDTKMSIIENRDAEPYRILKFYKGDKIMPNAIIPSASNVNKFLDMLLSGKINYVPYTELLNIWETNLELNNVKPGVNAAILGIVISEIYRDKTNPIKRFGEIMGKDPKINPLDYNTANSREVCSRNSTFAALTFQDMDAMITTSLNMHNYKKKQTVSPIEKIIKM